MERKLIKNYKKDDVLRLSFNQLAIDTFSINFEKWYQKGMWNDHYINYSFFEGEKCIANASYNKMKMVLDGDLIQAIQIGTVMTHMSYRGQGLAQRLIEEIIKDEEDNCELFFLCAEQKAAALYKRCGFEFRAENDYVIDVSSYEKRKTPLKTVDLTPSLFAEAKLKSKPLSNKLSAIDDIHIAHFYYNFGFDQCIYEPIENVFVIAEFEADNLLIYDVYTPLNYDFEALVSQMIHEGIGRVKCLFTLDLPVKGLNIIEGCKDWMVRPNPKKIPDGYKIPIISRA